MKRQSAVTILLGTLCLSGFASGAAIGFVPVQGCGSAFAPNQDTSTTDSSLATLSCLGVVEKRPEAVALLGVGGISLLSLIVAAFTKEPES